MSIKLDNYYCKTCGKKLRYRQCVEHDKLGHEVWHIKPGTEEQDYRYAQAPKALEGKISAESGKDIDEYVKGFVEPDDEILFIYHKGGRIQKFWDRFGDHRSIYQALVSGEYFQGTPAEFVDASARYMLAVAGYEPVPSIIPRSERDVYEETARLIREGQLRVYYDEDGRVKLETTGENGTEESDGGHTVTKAGVSAGGDQDRPKPEGLSSQEREEKPGEPG